MAVLEHDTWFYAKGQKSTLVAAGSEPPGKGWADSPAAFKEGTEGLTVVPYDEAFTAPVAE